MEVRRKAELARSASQIWRKVDTETKCQALLGIADDLMRRQEEILRANAQDLVNARKNNISGALLDRLTLSSERVRQLADAVREVAQLADPVGEVIHGKRLPSGLELRQIRVPIGVVAMIYEARPNVTADAAVLALKTGNAVVLRGGSEAINSNIAIANVLRDSLKRQGLVADTVQIIEDTDRSAVRELMRLNELIDVIIPRGGAGLIKAVVENSTVPVIETGVGNCHIYVDEGADLSKAIKIIDNAKTQRPGVCNALETLLVHHREAKELLPSLWTLLAEKKGVELRGCPKSREIVAQMSEAVEEDWSTEYLDLVLAIKVVTSLDEALGHIQRYSTGHSEAILTENYTNACRFVAEVDSAAVYVNASTRFTDGGQFGMGAEIGISTQKLHARGPMGLKELTTTKYVIFGQGNVRD